MLSPVGLPPHHPSSPDPELVPALDRAISVPSAIAETARWQVGSILSASVRFQNDELIFRIGDHFFTSRPIPGVSEYSRMSLLVSRDMSGELSLVPLLPLAGKAILRVAGVPSSIDRVSVEGTITGVKVASLASVPAVASPEPAMRLPVNAVRSLSARLHLPGALAGWLLGAMDGVKAAPTSGQPAAAGADSAAVPGLESRMQALAAAVTQSGLFFEAQLRERRPVSTADLKRRLLEVIDSQRGGEGGIQAWDALDELVALQGAATAAHRAGGTCFSFLMQSLDGIGGWWVTLERDQENPHRDFAGGDGRRERPPRFWRARLVGVSLPFGDIDIRIEQTGGQGIGVVILTDTADQRDRWDQSRAELKRRLEDARLSLSRWSVIAQEHDLPPPGSPGQLQSVRV